jgi:polar amino acid transport system substrate-binding protein
MSATESIDVARRQLAPHGSLRAAINLSNSLLVAGEGGPLGWRGVAPDIARSIADRLDVGLDLLPYAKPLQIADSAGTGAWTLAFIGAEPARAQSITFSPSYSQIEACYLVPPGSSLRDVEEVDQPGVKVLAFRGSAYGIWLEANLRHATLVHALDFADAFERFHAGEADALASLRPKLLDDARAWPGTRILEGRFMTVQQAIGTTAGQVEAAAFVRQFVDELSTSRLVEELIRKHGVTGLTATPPGAPV